MSFDQDLIIDVARLARMAYCDRGTVLALYDDVKSGREVASDDLETMEVLKRVTTPPVFLDDVTSDAQGYGVMLETTNGPVTVVVYRGTNDLADCVADATVRLVPMQTKAAKAPPGVLVHQGFLGQCLGLEEDTLDFLKAVYLFDDANVNSPTEPCQSVSGFLDGPPLLICGHSLGSSVSAIAALSLRLRYGKGVQYIGFGTPRVGNQAWVDLFENNIQTRLRVKHSRDPIDAILAPIVYSHITPKMHIGRADPFPDIAFLFDICDHNMAAYIADLKVDMAAEAPLSWIQFVCSFAINTPVKLYTLVRTAAFYHPF